MVTKVDTSTAPNPPLQGRVEAPLSINTEHTAGFSPRSRGIDYEARAVHAARKARGCDLAFEHPVEIKLEGDLPDGGKDSVTVRVTSIVSFIVMKGMALADRMKEKDTWDIYYCLKNYPGGLDPLVDAFKPFMSHGLVKEGLEKIAEK